METGIPWWAIFGAIVIFSSLLAVFTMHTPESTDPVSTADIERLLDNRLFQVGEMKAVVATLSQKPLGTDGTTVAKLPEGTNVVTLPDGTIRLALPVRISGTGVSGFTSAAVAALTVRKPGDDR